ncbi:MAG: helix-turn-helix domain-containing protein, partial [Candidatus Diapherotrites archaeon]|nr:helix-turn-helix domain-containing protein [Candidatus Diapherotrites archaeon]
MECELCGKNSFSLKEVNVDGVKFMACEKCAMPYAKKPLIQKTEPATFIPKGKKIRNFADSQEFTRINLIPEWGKIIRKKREEAELTIEELAEKVFEKESTINKLENEKTHPSKQLI